MKRECTFQPDTQRSRRSAAPGREGSRDREGGAPPHPAPLAFMRDANAAEAARRKRSAFLAAAAEQARAAREAEELAACPFAPQLPPREAPQTQPPPPIRGLATFIRQREAALRLKAEAAERERKAFLTDIASRPVRTHTVPEPFELTGSGERELRRRERALAAAESVYADCTFSPCTLEGTALRRMLAVAI